ncbi:PLP-dependent aminotransferase family protein [Bradyrhizobium sp. BEA-2-5]|uniref:aminotransferase-like domain-containing protein n=1 Tax=Bradyrhizobium sp. BEA-2-5 TaxID=3080015 RepID=UPI00293F50BA|nr:PLP-dependent aminotransferase family protein [Bradyrhizobium sp. BEA-2-5]WOH80294.1 PLP-dependent aminotransferase family protein [Bradyrhizobium sp. BEA-2-5]
MSQDIAHGLKSALTCLAAQQTVGSLLNGSIAGGTAEDRLSGARFLSRRFGETIDPNRIVVTNGTQSALHLLFRNFVISDGPLLTEAFTYGVLTGIASHTKVRLQGLALDHEGLDPTAVSQALEQSSGRIKLLYCNPTIHNPTTATMSLERRQEIAAVARKHSIRIIEDDVLGLLHPEAPPPIAALAPDLTWYIMGLTKCLAHGMRIAYLLAPSVDDARDLLERERRYSSWFPAPLHATIVRQWIDDGTAERATSAIRREMDERHELARFVLREHSFRGSRGSMHIWLNLPSPWSNLDFQQAAEKRGVLVRTADKFAVHESISTPAIRLSLSSPPDRQSLASGLSRLALLLDDGLSARSIAGGGA